MKLGNARTEVLRAKDLLAEAASILSEVIPDITTVTTERQMTSASNHAARGCELCKAVLDADAVA